MVCSKCGERQGDAAPQCVEVSSTGVRFVEHSWGGGSGRSLTSSSSRGDAMRALTEARPRSQPRASQPPQISIPGMGPDMSEFFRLSGVSQPPQTSSRMLREQQPPYAPTHAHAPVHARNTVPGFLREDMPAPRNPFIREDLPAPPETPFKVQRTGRLTHAEILRECAPICRRLGPGHMGTANPGRLARTPPITVKFR